MCQARTHHHWLQAWLKDGHRNRHFTDKETSSALSGLYNEREAVMGCGWSECRAWALLRATLLSSPRTMAPSNLLFALSSADQLCQFQCLCSCPLCLECLHALHSSFTSLKLSPSISSGKPSTVLQRKSPFGLHPQLANPVGLYDNRWLSHLR